MSVPLIVALSKSMLPVIVIIKPEVVEIQLPLFNVTLWAERLVTTLIQLALFNVKLPFTETVVPVPSIELAFIVMSPAVTVMAIVEELSIVLLSIDRLPALTTNAAFAVIVLLGSMVISPTTMMLVANWIVLVPVISIPPVPEMVTADPVIELCPSVKSPLTPLRVMAMVEVLVIALSVIERLPALTINAAFAVIELLESMVISPVTMMLVAIWMLLELPIVR